MFRPIAVAAQVHEWDNPPHSPEAVISNYWMEIFPEGHTGPLPGVPHPIVLPRGEDISLDTHMLVHVMVHCLLGLTC